jgi:hypothetical protein
MIKISNISTKSGLSRDYSLALGSVINLLESIEDNESSRTMHLAKRSFLHRELPYYEDFFSKERYMNVITDKNKADMKKINNTIDIINSYRLKGIIEYKEIKPLISKIIDLIG